MEMSEVWKPIPGFPGYVASSLGRVGSYRLHGSPPGRSGGDQSARTPKLRLLKASPDPGGYLRVNLQANGKTCPQYVNRLVLLAFVGEPPPGHETRHFPDRDKTNNRPDNLSWGTHKQNVADKAFHGTTTRHLGESHPNTDLTNEDVLRIRAKLADGVSVAEVARQENVTIGIVYSIRSRKSWRHI